MSERREHLGQREELRARKKRVAAEVASHRDSLRAALPVAAESEELDGEHVLALAIALNERLEELKGLNRKITILTRELGD